MKEANTTKETVMLLTGHAMAGRRQKDPNIKAFVSTT